jgi:hypothetical protein
LYRCKKQESKGLKPAADGGGGFRKQAVSVAISLALAARAPAPATPGEAGAIGCNPAAASRNNSSTRSARSGAWFGCTRHRAGRRSRATKTAPDKLFFFGDAQLNRQGQGGSVLTTVPTAAERTGNLSDWLAAGYQIYDPATGNQTTGVGRVPFAGNIIPTNRLSPQALALFQYFPQPNSTVAGTSYANNSASGSVAITGNLWDTRWDYYLNPKNTIFGRYSYQAFTEQAPGAFGLEAGGPTIGNYAGDSQALNQSLAVGWTNTISPTLVNEFRLGYMRYHVFDVPNGYGTDPATQANIPGLNLDKTYTSGMPAFFINNPNGSSQLGYALGINQCNCPLTQSERQIQFVDNLNKIHGKSITAQNVAEVKSQFNAANDHVRVLLLLSPT